MVKRLPAMLLLVVGAIGIAAAAESDFTVDRRVDFEMTLERIRYERRTGAPATPESAIDRDMIRRRVVKRLQESQALDVVWRHPITANALDRELARMARDTRDPDALRAMFAALGNDPRIVKEILVRPVLVERRVRNMVGDDRDLTTDRFDAHRMTLPIARAGGALPEIGTSATDGGPAPSGPCGAGTTRTSMR